MQAFETFEKTPILNNPTNVDAEPATQDEDDWSRPKPPSGDSSPSQYEK